MIFCVIITAFHLNPDWIVKWSQLSNSTRFVHPFEDVKKKEILWGRKRNHSFHLFGNLHLDFHPQTYSNHNGGGGWKSWGNIKSSQNIHSYRNHPNHRRRRCQRYLKHIFFDLLFTLETFGKRVSCCGSTLIGTMQCHVTIQFVCSICGLYLFRLLNLIFRLRNEMGGGRRRICQHDFEQFSHSGTFNQSWIQWTSLVYFFEHAKRLKCGIFVSVYY